MEIEQMDVEMRLAGAIDDLLQVQVNNSNQICSAIIKAAHKWRLTTHSISVAWSDYISRHMAANCVVTSSEI